VVVPCGKAKIWDRESSHGPTPARQAYTSTFFCVNRRYAEVFGESWIILSATYGFIAPDFVISAAYNVTFKDLRSNPIATWATVSASAAFTPSSGAIAACDSRPVYCTRMCATALTRG